MKKIGLLVIALVAIIGFMGCDKEFKFTYRVDYQMYEITPKMAKGKLSLKTLQSHRDMMLYKDTYFTDSYKVKNNELLITGRHIWTAQIRDFISSNFDVDSSVVLFDDDTGTFEITNTPASLHFGKWKKTTATTWSGDGAIVEKETHYYVGIYKITTGAHPYKIEVTSGGY